MEYKSRRSPIDYSTRIESSSKGMYRTASCSIIPSSVCDTPKLLTHQNRSDLNNSRIDKLEKDMNKLKSAYWNISPIQQKTDSNPHINLDDVKSAIKKEKSRLKKLQETFRKDLEKWESDLVHYQIKPTSEKAHQLKTIKTILERRQKYLNKKSSCLKLATNWLKRANEDSVSGSENSDVSDFAMLYNATYNKLNVMKHVKPYSSTVQLVSTGPLKYNRSHYMKMNSSRINTEMVNYGLFLDDLRDRITYIMHVLKSKYF